MTFFNREREWKFYMEEIFSLNNNLLINNDVSLNGNLISKNTFVNGNIIIGNNFGIKFDDGTTITSGNITSTSGGVTSNVTSQEIDDRISNYLFNKLEAPTDSSHNFQIITSNDGTHPTITLLWSNPPTKRVAFPFGTTPGYNTPVTGNFINDFNSNKNITHLPYSKELKIEFHKFHEENTPHSWSNLTLHSDGTGITQHIIPNSVITANLNSSNIAPTLLANTVSNTYTEFKSGKGLTIGNKYQFRIYLTNEITEEDASYNYLYIPSETEYIAFGGFANVTAPTEILFPENDFYNLQIKGINGNIYAETGMNTTFPIPDSYDLRVRYGFDIDISSNINSKQMPNEKGSSKSGFFITENLRNSNFTEDIDLVSGLQLQNGDYINWYPEFDYNVRNFFMEANLDISGNIAETIIGNSITTVRPSRGNLLASTKYLGNLNQSNFTNKLYGLSFPDINNSSISIIGENIYNYDTNIPFENVFIIDNINSFNIRFNPNIEYLINNSDSHIGIDSIDISLCQFVGNIIINNNNKEIIDYYYRIEPPITTQNVITYKLVYTSYRESLQLGNELFSSTYMHNWVGTNGTNSEQAYKVADRAELFVREVIDPLISSQGNIDIYYKDHKPSENNNYYPYFVSSYEEYYHGTTLKKSLDGVYAWPGYDGIDKARRAARREVDIYSFRYFAVKDTTILENLGYTLYQSPTNDPDMIYKSTNFSKGFLQVIDLSAHPFDENYVGNIKDGMIINANVIENSSIKGYYTDINLFEIGVRNVNLTHYKDMADIYYKYYKASVNQIVNNNTILNNVGNIYFNFGIAKKSASDIAGLHILTDPEVTLDNNFFGLKRPNNSTTININYTLTLSNINEFWRSNLNIINTLDLKYNHNSINLDSISSTDKEWNSNSNTKNINPNLSINPSNLWYKTSNNTLLYSRNYTGTHQLKIKYNINNNIGRSQTTRESSIDFGFGSTSKILWWDYTWGINNGPPSNFFSTTPSSANSTIQFINAVGNNTFSSNTIFDHGTILAVNQLMWANGGFRSGGISQSDNNNPYINYTNFYNPSNVLRDYESIKTSGDTINFNFSSSPIYNRNWYNSTIDTAIITITRTFKFITFNIEMPYLNEIESNSSLDANGPAFGIRIKNISQNIIQKDTLNTTPSTNSGYVLFHNEYRSNVQEDKIDGNKTFSSTIPSTAIKTSYRTTINNYNYYHIFNVSSNSSTISGAEKTILQISIGIDNSINDSIGEISISFLKN